MKPTSPFPVWLMALVGACYAVAIALCVLLASRGMAEPAILGMIFCVATIPLTLLLWHQGTLARSSAIPPDRNEADHPDKLDALRDELRLLTSHAALSDKARRVLNRDQERELLRQAIEEEVQRSDYDSALVLVGELSERFGSRADAEDFRERIESSRHTSRDESVREGVAMVEGLIAQRRWNDASGHAARLARVLPGIAMISALSERTEHARQSYKDDLERRFLVAAQEGKADDALVLLRELDFYLTPEEAEPFRELARGIIGRARENLGAEFKLAVSDRRWAEAASLGERVIREFPNTRMAAEIRGVIDGIREKAGSRS